MYERFNEDRKITLTRDEMNFLYYQLLARKQHFEEDMMDWASRKDSKEVQRCAKAIEKIEAISKKISN